MTAGPFDNVQGARLRLRLNGRGEAVLACVSPLDFAALIDACNRYNGGPLLGGPVLPKEERRRG